MCDFAGAASPWALPSTIHRCASAGSLAVCHRSSGAFARLHRTIRSSSGGIAGCTLETGAGCELMIAATMLAGLPPVKARFPASIS
jgi:hypothetical protein